MMEGIIFDLKRGSFHDGPGIRTVVFLKGCPLHCIWCHNPESQKAEPELLYDNDKCIDCGNCVDVCQRKAQTLNNGLHELLRSQCNSCMKCVRVCPTNALQVAGYRISAQKIINEACDDRAFYQASGGGLTISGGEPLAQIDFTAEILFKAKQNGLHTCLDTCGNASIDKIDMVLEYTDIFLFDLKLTDPYDHLEYTGVPLEPILQNLDYINKHNKQILLRCPVIPGVNDTQAHKKIISKIKHKYQNIISVEYLEYHDLGNDKKRLMGLI